MYRYQWTVEIQYGRKREFLEIVDHIKRLEESRGWVVASVWTAFSGRLHFVVLEAHYPDLAAIESEEEQRSSDAEFNDLMGRLLPLQVQSSSHVQLFVEHVI